MDRLQKTLLRPNEREMYPLNVFSGRYDSMCVEDYFQQMK